MSCSNETKNPVEDPGITGGSFMTSITEGIAAGGFIGWFAAIGEITIRLIYPGGLSSSELLPVIVRVLGTYSAVGASVGALSAIFSFPFSPLAHRGESALRSAFLTLVGGIVLIIDLWLIERYSLSPLEFRTIFIASVLGGSLLLLFVRLRKPVERLLFRPLKSRGALTVLAPMIAIPMAYAAPWLILDEPLDTMAGISWRGGPLFAGMAVGGITFFCLILLNTEKPNARKLVRKTGLYYIVITAMFSLTVGLWTQPEHLENQRPNVVLIVIDTLRADHLSTYGYEKHTSPEITALAERGTLFLDAVSAAPFTMPSMASLLTSRYPYEHGVRYHPSPLISNELTLAEILRENGYVTGAVVSNGLLTRHWGFDQGFGLYDTNKESPLGEAGELFLFRLLKRLQRGNEAYETAGHAIRWVRRHHNQPFFLWVHFMDPHFPYDPPPPYDRLFSTKETNQYKALLRSYRRGELPFSNIALGGTLSRQILSGGISQYDGEIAFSDTEVGRLLDAIDKMQLQERTLVVLTSDHGEALGDHGVNFAHDFNTYEELMHVPLIMAWPPRVPRGRRVSSQVRLVDIAPTIIDLVGLTIPPSMRGRALFPLPEDGNPNVSSPPAYGENAPLLPGHPSYSIISKFPEIYRSGMEGKWRMLRYPPWKLIHIPGRPNGENLLFNIELDPGEEKDRSTSNPEELEDLLRYLRSHLEREREAPKIAPTELRSHEIEKLRALGYVD